MLGFAWYQKLKPRTEEEIACACEEDDLPDGEALVKFDKSKTSAEDIIKSIDATSYKVGKHELLNN